MIASCNVQCVMCHVTALTLHMTQSTLHKTVVVLACVLMVGATPLRAEEATEAEKATVRKTQEKLNFQLPPDWPIERRGGMVGPIPVEEYLGMKFKAFEARLQTIEQNLNGLDLRLRILEEQAKKSTASLKSSEKTAPEH